MVFVSSLAAAALVAGKTNAETNTEGDGNDDNDNNEETPPFKLAGASGRICGMLDLLVALLQVVSGLLRVLLGCLDDGFLLLDHGGEFLIEKSQLRKRLFDALQFVVTSPDVAE